MKNLVNKINNLKIMNELELDSKKLFLIFLVSAVVLYVDFSYILKSQLAGLSKNSVELAKRQSELSILEKDLMNMQNIKSKQTLPDQKGLLNSKRLITESQISTLLQDISNLANSNDVRILQVKPSRDQNLAPNAKTNTISGASPLYVTLDLLGGYHQLGKFINDLENGQTFVMVQDIKIESQKENLLKQKATLTLKAYVKK